MKEILIVEDDPAHGELIVRSFENQTDEYRLTRISTVVEAADLLQQRIPDLIIADYRLPDGNGIELVKHSENLCPIIIMTAYGDEQLAVQAIKSGAMDYVVKAPDVFTILPRITERVMREWTLLIEQKQAEQKIEQLLKEKEILLRDVHQRVKNNMVTVEGLLSLQADMLEDENAVSALHDAAGRVRGISLLYEQLYRLDNFREMSVQQYLIALIEDIRSRFPEKDDVRVKKQFEDIVLSANLLSNIGIIINELVTNAYKHAFPADTHGYITVRTESKGNTLVLQVEDNGKGFPDSEDHSTRRGFGLNMVAMLSEQMDASMQIETKKGTTVTLCIKNY